ncbi:MAG: AAA family ATPase [Oscillospiraceae bacterium]|nr:AAA family ATPase [Oscillospiraceae bacterium]
MHLNNELSAKLNELLSLIEKTRNFIDVIGIPEDLKRDFSNYAVRLGDIVNSASDSTTSDVAPISDFRLKSLLVRNFRKYGVLSEDADAYFGMEMTDSELMVLLGENGSGKSSIFNAAEYLFTGRIGEAEYRDYDVSSYFKRGDSSCEIIAFTKNDMKIKSGETVTPKELRAIPLSHFFISENSIYKSGKMIDGENFLPYFCELLGLGDVYRFVNGRPGEGDSVLERVCQQIESKMMNLASNHDLVLDELKDATRDFQRSVAEQDKVELRNRLATLEGIYKEWQSLSTETLDINEQLKKVNRFANLYLVPEFREWITFSKDLKAQLPNTSGKSRTFKEALDRQKAISSFDKEKAFGNMKTKLIRLIDNIKKMLSQTHPDIVLQRIIDLSLQYARLRDNQLPDGLKDEVVIDSIFGVPSQLRAIGNSLIIGLEMYVSEFVDEKFRSFIISLFNDSFLASGETITIGSLENHTIRIDVNGVSINKYFNTFRYRLFFLIMQTAVCLRLMEQNKVVFPIMLDDIFYANDYHNKTELCKFFKVVVDVKGWMFEDNIRPQIIFLSHDEQIVMTMHQKDWEFNGKVEYGKLLNISNIEKIEMTQRKVKDDSGATFKYHNIYIPIYRQ